VQIDRWLKPSVKGQRTCAICITEPSAGSDAAGIKTHAKKNDKGWVRNGSKHFISDGEWSDFFLVSAKTGEKEISMFMVDKGLAGFTVGKDQKMMGLRGTPHLELFFDNVQLEEVALLGEIGQGFKLAMGALNVVRLAQVGARAVGKAAHVCELMLSYANDRQQFNTRIGDFQMVQANAGR
jgi:acyl-CoA dehydrogenase